MELKIIKIKAIEKGYTYKDIAKKVGVTEQTIINLANGRVPKNIKTFIKICKLLDIDIKDLKC